jgi:cell division septation protein DedD
MSTRNRGTQARYPAYTPRRSAGSSLLRGTLIMVPLILGCFLLGFFVVARMVHPVTPIPGAETAQTPVTNPTPAAQPQPTAPPTTAAPPAVHPSVAPPAAAPTKPSAGAVPGPSIDPVEGDNVQQPDSLDSAPADGSTSDNGTPNDNAGGDSGNNPFAAVTPNRSDTSSSGDSTTHRRRRRRRHQAESDAVQNPDTLDNSNSGETGGDSTSGGSNSDGANAGSANGPRPSGTKAAAPASGAASSSSGLYRVQIGIFSTQDAADAQAKQARDHGFDVTIHPYQSGGRTLYRVQQGLYRQRANADAAKQRLNAAGIDATVSNP